jgi:hypothetical protein
MGRLQDRLDAIREAIEREAPAEIVEVVHRATRDVEAEAARRPGLKVGDVAPPFRLPDQDGNEVDSAVLLARGPLVMTFFRGHW